MALQATLKQFLALPNTSQLAENSSIHYITTLVTYNGPAEIIKHLNSQSYQLKEKEEFLDAIEVVITGRLCSNHGTVVLIDEPINNHKPL